MNDAGEPALTVFAASVDALADLAPRNEVTQSGKLGPGPLGAGLELAPGSVSVLATNKPFGNSESRGAGFLADASSLAGRRAEPGRPPHHGQQHGGAPGPRRRG